MTECEVTIGRLFGAQEGEIVRIDAVVGTKLLGRIEMPVADFAKCLMGLGCVPGMFSTVRGHRTPAPQERTDG